MEQSGPTSGNQSQMERGSLERRRRPVPGRDGYQLLGGAEHGHIDEHTACDRRRLERLSETLDRLACRGELVLRGQVRLLDDRELIRMDRRTSEVPELATASARAGKPPEVADVG